MAHVRQSAPALFRREGTCDSHLRRQGLVARPRAGTHKRRAEQCSAVHASELPVTSRPLRTSAKSPVLSYR